MKYCTQCGNQVSDNELYCNKCGNKIVDNSNINNQCYNEQISNSSLKQENFKPDNPLTEWIPVIGGVIGAIVGWFLSGLLGMTLGICVISSAYMLKKSKKIKMLPYILSCFFGIIDVILYICCIILNV